MTETLELVAPRYAVRWGNHFQTVAPVLPSSRRLLDFRFSAHLR